MLATSPHVPTISVIVPVFEHWHLVPGLLDRLEQQTFNQHKFEVLLVDNGSTHFDPPKLLPANAKVLRCDTPGSYAARNHAIAQAKGEWLAFTDADCLPAEGWLQAYMHRIEALHQGPVVLAGAIHMHAKAVPNRYEQYDLVKGIPQAWYVKRGYAVTANLALPASLFLQLGGFNEGRFSGGDAELTRRCVALGIPLHYVPEACVIHPARDSWQAMATKARRIKGGQLTAGTRKQRVLWWLRTFTPPLVAWYRFLCSSRHPLTYRLSACLLQASLWGIEVREAYQIARYGKTERR